MDGVKLNVHKSYLYRSIVSASKQCAYDSTLVFDLSMYTKLLEMQSLSKLAYISFHCKPIFWAQNDRRIAIK
jgi:hypothetical protein